MSQPASLIFYIRYRYALSKGQTVAGTQIMRQNTAQGFARQNGWALDPYYSSQEVRGEEPWDICGAQYAWLVKPERSCDGQSR